MEREQIEKPSLMARIKMAFRLVFNSDYAAEVSQALKDTIERAKQPELPPERVHASGLFLLGALQREGRLVDFLQQDVAGFSDEEIGAAARVVHAGCRKALGQYVGLEPAVTETEGSRMRVPTGFDAQRVRLTGNVTGQPPFTGTVKHPGWVAKEIKMPVLAAELDPRVIAPAEVELG